MTPYSALSVIGAISLFVVTVRGILAGLVRLADDRRAARAHKRLGRWSSGSEAAAAPTGPVPPPRTVTTTLFDLEAV